MNKPIPTHLTARMPDKHNSFSAMCLGYTPFFGWVTQGFGGKGLGYKRVVSKPIRRHYNHQQDN